MGTQTKAGTPVIKLAGRVIPLVALEAKKSGNTYFVFGRPNKSGEVKNNSAGVGITPLAKTLPGTVEIDGVEYPLVAGMTGTNKDGSQAVDKETGKARAQNPKVELNQVIDPLPSTGEAQTVLVRVSQPRPERWQVAIVVNGVSTAGGGQVFDLDEIEASLAAL